MGPHLVQKKGRARARPKSSEKQRGKWRVSPRKLGYWLRTSADASRDPASAQIKQPPGGWQWNRFDAAHQDHEVLEVIVAAHEIFVSKDGIANIELRTLRAPGEEPRAIAPIGVAVIGTAGIQIRLRKEAVALRSAQQEAEDFR